MLAELIYITEFIKYIIFFKHILKEDIERIWIGLIGLLGYTIMVQFDVPAGLTAVGLVMICLICMLPKFELKLCGKIIMIAVLLNCTGEIIIIFIKGTIEYFWNFKRTNIEYYFITNIVLIIIMLFLAALKIKRINIIHISVNVIYSILGVVVFLLTITVGLLEYLAGYIQDKFLLAAVNIFSISTFGGIIILLVIVLYIYRINEQMKTAFETEKIMRESQRMYYETLLEKENETVKYRHDLSNHILCLKELAAAGEMENVQNYIASMNRQFKKINNKVYETGNMILDIMLNYYVRNLEKETKVAIIGRIENDFKIDNYVLCGIFSNLMKNAVEEINRNEIQNPEFLIILSNGKRNVKIEMRNTSDEKEIKNGLIKTSKKDTKNHGIGLKNIRRMVEKCGGIYEIKYSGGIFTAEVYLPCAEEKSMKRRDIV